MCELKERVTSHLYMNELPHLEYVCVIWLVLHVLQLLLIIFTQQIYREQLYKKNVLKFEPP